MTLTWAVSLNLPSLLEKIQVLREIYVILSRNAGYVALTPHSTEWQLIIRQVRNERDVVVECPEYSAFHPAISAVKKLPFNKYVADIWTFDARSNSTSLSRCHVVDKLERMGVLSLPHRCYCVHVTSDARLSLCTCSRLHVWLIAIEYDVTYISTL